MTLRIGKYVGEHVYVKGHEREYVVWGTHKKHIICVAPYAMIDGPDPDDPDAVLDKVKLRDVLIRQKRSGERGLYSNGKRSVVVVTDVWLSPKGDCKLAFYPVLPIYDDTKYVLDRNEFDSKYPLRVSGVQHE